MRACAWSGRFGALAWFSPQPGVESVAWGGGGVAVWSAKRSALPVNCSFYCDMDEGGLDTEGKTYASRKQMWEEEAGEDAAGNPRNAQKKQEWYHKGVSYWEVNDR